MYIHRYASSEKFVLLEAGCKLGPVAVSMCSAAESLAKKLSIGLQIVSC